VISALCVDDEQVLLDLYKLFLEKSGEIQVDTADSVKTAVKKLKKTRYDVIVSDYAMPEYDGVAFLKCILPKYGDIPFILFTGKGCEDTVIEALNNGARFYVQKGEDPKEQFADLIHKIKQAVGLTGVRDALRISEQRYRKLFETANDGIILLDADTEEILNANPFLVHLIGSSLEEILGKNLWDIGIFRDVDLVKKAFLELRTKKTTRQEELPLVAKNGQEIIVEFVCTIYIVDHADVIQCNIRDITGRKRAEEQLKESEEKFRNVFDWANDAILIHTLTDGGASGHFIEVNQVACRMLGYSREELLTMGPSDIIAPELHPQLDDINRQAQTKDTFLLESRLRRKDDTTFPVESSVHLVTFDRTRIWISHIRDISERKRAEEALRIIQEKYTKAFISAPDAITISELDSGRFVEVNEAATAIFGYSREELIGKSALELGIWQKKEDRDDFFDQIRANGRVEQFEIVERRKSGELYNASVTADTIAIGNVRHLIAIIRDISDLKRAEEQLKHFNEELESQVRSRTAELERTNTLLEDWVIQRTRVEESVRKSLNEREILLREIHHRVKNNLQVILSLIRLQSRTIKDPYLLDTLGDFQNRIMAMAHVHERMCLSEDISRIDLSEIVTFLGTSLFASYEADPRQIRLNVEMKDLQVTIDTAIPISLIINELISNSIKHAFPKGTTGEITIAGRREANTLVISIRDTGIGIPQDIDWMRNNQSLGLRLVISLVEQLSGTIELDRTAGTTFNIVVKEK